jgi:hypothetical protein
VRTDGSSSFKRMLAFGFFGCKKKNIWEFQSPGWARSCCLFEFVAPPAAPKEPADLFDL